MTNNSDDKGTRKPEHGRCRLPIMCCSLYNNNITQAPAPTRCSVFIQIRIPTYIIIVHPNTCDDFFFSKTDVNSFLFGDILLCCRCKYAIHLKYYNILRLSNIIIHH